MVRYKSLLHGIKDWKACPNLTSMAAAGGPKSAERKPSKREKGHAMPRPSRFFSRLQHNPKELPPEGSGKSEAIRGQFNIAAASDALQSSCQCNVPSVALESSSHYSICHIFSAHHLLIQSGAFLRQVEVTPNLIVTQQIGTPTHPCAPQRGLHGIPHAPPTTNG